MEEWKNGRMVFRGRGRNGLFIFPSFFRLFIYFVAERNGGIKRAPNPFKTIFFKAVNINGGYFKGM